MSKRTASKKISLISIISEQKVMLVGVFATLAISVLIQYFFSGVFDPFSTLFSLALLLFFFWFYWVLNR